MLNNLKKRSEGFTIIEVLIVLAIAGLIMLIIFLAVPALNRNQRNNARNTEASRIAGAVSECLANRNGVVASCDTDGEVDQGDVTQLTTVNFANGGATAPASSTSAAGVWFQRSCNTDGASSVASTNTREFVVLYTLENGITRCITG